MRHLVKGRKLGRTTSHRKATMKALSVALIKHERITTTLAKAKELRLHVEPIITRSKKDSTHNRRLAFSFLRDKSAVTKLFDEIGELVADRPGGYTRVIKLGKRAGDNADMAMVELVDYNDEQPETPGKKKKRTRRAGRGKASADAAAKQQSAEKKPAGEGAKKETKADSTDAAEPNVAKAATEETSTSKKASKKDEPGEEKKAEVPESEPEAGKKKKTQKTAPKKGDTSSSKDSSEDKKA